MPTLLITDDHPSVLQTLEYVLANADLRVVLAASGAAALRHAEHEAIDAALVDLHMPVMDGFALTRALKEQAAQSGRTLPVWVMTAAHTAAAAELARTAGAQALLKKPFDGEGFRAELSRVLSPDASPATFAG